MAPEDGHHVDAAVAAHVQPAAPPQEDEEDGPGRVDRVIGVLGKGRWDEGVVICRVVAMFSRVSGSIRSRARL